MKLQNIDPLDIEDVIIKIEKSFAIVFEENDFGFEKINKNFSFLKKYKSIDILYGFSIFFSPRAL